MVRKQAGGSEADPPPQRQAPPVLYFGSYRLDQKNAQLWRESRAVRLTPKAFHLLHYLVSRPGQLISKDELFQAVWSETVVNRNTLTWGMKELRKALEDDAKTPRYIATVHRRGYRWIAGTRGAGRQAPPPSSPVFSFQSEASNIVGREAELTQLQGWLDTARAGERQIVFVTGEPGIGKTTVVETFLSQLATAQEPVWIGRGQCIEHYGAGEAYMPVLEALGRLCREAEGERVVALLRQYAPTWLLQMPALLSEAERESLQRQVQGTTHERMLREMAEVVEVLSAERTLVLWLEDLHWSDYSTLELLSVLARRREPARLLVLGTYRPGDVLGREHPLQSVKQEMHLHGRCAELPLGFLSAAAVEAYLTSRLEARAVSRELIRLVHQRTEGNPLFMVNVVNELVTQGVLTQRDGQWELAAEIGEIMVPAGLRQFIEQQIGRVGPEDREILEAASVVGMEFSAATVAAGIEAEEQIAEKRCEALVRRGQFLQTRGIAEWPDGTVTARYGFIHALYQEVLYEQVTAGRRVRLHGQIGAREEAGYGAQARQIAAELAVRFEQGRDYGRAVQYRRRAAENALGRSAHQEAMSHLTRGLKLLSVLPDSLDRTQQELPLQIMLGASLSATKGYTAPESERVYTRAQELCQRVGETPQLVPVLLGLWAFYQVRGELHKARELGERRLHLAQTIGHPFLLLASHVTLGMTLFYQGEFVRAKAHWEKGAECYQLHQRPAPTFYSAEDPWVTCLAYLAWTLGLLGYPDQALESSLQALSSAQELSQPLSLALALDHASALHQLRREAGGVQERTEACVALAKDQGYPFWIAGGSVMRGWALSQQHRSEEGITQIQGGLAALRAMGAELGRPYCLALLAEAYEQAGQAAAGLRTIEEGLKTAHSTGEGYYEAELYRLKGELTLQSRVQSPESERPKRVFSRLSLLLVGSKQSCSSSGR